MSGGNNIPRYAKVNREDELAPLKFRGIQFRTPSRITVSPLAPLTPDQVMSNLFVNIPGTLTFPTAASIISNTSTQGLVSQYSVAVGSEWQIDVTNFAAGVVTLAFPGYTFISPTLDLTLDPFETRTIRFSVVNPSTLYVY